jgi:uncharacterized membrane protein
MLCFVPGLLLAPGWMAAFCLVARGESDAIAALKRGWSSSKPSLLMAAVTMLVISILMSIGAIACYVGIFLTLPFGFIAQYHLSRQLLDDAPRYDARTRSARVRWPARADAAGHGARAAWLP